MFKLVALAALGYGAYRMVSNRAGETTPTKRLAVAGGPVSPRARLQRDPTIPPEL